MVACVIVFSQGRRFMSDRTVSIKDVARAAGVSTATVSRALSNGSHVRPAVRERVLAAAAQLGYRPNLVARSLRVQRSKTIGLIVSDIRNPFFTAISRSVEDTAYEAGYGVLLCNTDEEPRREARYLNLMRDTNVAGIIFSPTPATMATFSSLPFELPVVVVDRFMPDAEVDAVLLDNQDAAYRLARHLLENGYRRIAALVGDVGTTGSERLRGYEQALREAGVAPDPTLIRAVAPRIEAGYTAACDLLALVPAPDALFAGNSLLAAGALQAIRERGLIIPRDVALVSFDETTWETLVEPEITLIAQPTDEIGKAAAELLLQRVADPLRPPRRILLKGQLRIRGSSAPRRLPASRAHESR